MYKVIKSTVFENNSDFNMNKICNSFYVDLNHFCKNLLGVNDEVFDKMTYIFWSQIGSDYKIELDVETLDRQDFDKIIEFSLEYFKNLGFYNIRIDQTDDRLVEFIISDEDIDNYVALNSCKASTITSTQHDSLQNICDNLYEYCKECAASDLRIDSDTFLNQFKVNEISEDNSNYSTIKLQFILDENLTRSDMLALVECANDFMFDIGLENCTFVTREDSAYCRIFESDIEAYETIEGTTETKSGTYWYFTRHGVMPGSVPKYVNILDILDTPNGSYFLADGVINTKDLNYYDIYEKEPDKIESAETASSSKYDEYLTENFNGSKYGIHYTSVDTSPDADPWKLFKEFKAQVSKISPYDDADYAWATIENGTITIYVGTKSKYKIYYVSSEDSDLENNEWCESIINMAMDELEDINKTIKPKMMYD